MFYRLITFLRSIYWHLLRGSPKSTVDEINYRYYICISCDKFDDDMCLECGCNVNNKKIFLNKLAWADQKCPLNKWGSNYGS
jgi:hypothetical protein